MNTKRYLLASIAVFIFIFVFEWVFHGMALGEVYRNTSHLWRSHEDMTAHMHWMILGQFLFAFVISFIFTKGYEDRGIAEGLRFGALMALLFITLMLIDYSVIPYPPYLLGAWVIGIIVEMLIAGGILAGIYRE